MDGLCVDKCESDPKIKRIRWRWRYHDGMTESGYYLLLMNLSTVMMLTLLHCTVCTWQQLLDFLYIVVDTGDDDKRVAM